MLRVVMMWFAVLAVSAGGCVTQGTHDDTVAELTTRIQAAKANATAYAEKLRTEETEKGELQVLVDKAAAREKELTNQLAAAKTEAADAQKKYDALGGAFVDRIRQIPGVRIDKEGGIQATVSFALGGAKVAPDAMANLQALAKTLAATKGPVYVDGHSDNSPVASLEARRKYTDNLGLSLARAAAVGRVLISKGVPGKRLVLRGWGSERPIAKNDTAAGRAKNRRVEIRFAVEEASAEDAEAAPAEKTEAPAEVAPK